MTADELPNVVGRPLPFTSTWLAESKPLPEISSDAVVVLPPTTTLGETAFTTGLGFTTFSETTFDRPPPGGVTPEAGGFNTAIRTEPAVAVSDGCRVTMRRLAFLKFACRFAPFAVTSEVGTKPEPFMVIVVDCPAGTLVGVIDEIKGMGAAVAVTVKSTVLDVPPPGAGVNT